MRKNKGYFMMLGVALLSVCFLSGCGAESSSEKNQQSIKTERVTDLEKSTGEEKDKTDTEKEAIPVDGEGLNNKRNEEIVEEGVKEEKEEKKEEETEETKQKTEVVNSEKDKKKSSSSKKNESSKKSSKTEDVGASRTDSTTKGKGDTSSAQSQTPKAGTSTKPQITASPTPGTKPQETAKPTPAPHTHSWAEQYKTVHHDAVTHVDHHEATGHYETQVVQAAYDEPIFESRAICGCGADITNNIDMHYADGCGSGYSVKDIQVGTKHHDAVTKQVWVQDTAAWDETVIDTAAWDEQVVSGYICNGCGAVK